MSIQALLKRQLPQFSLAQVQALTSQLYGIEGEYREVVSERDLSWLIKQSSGQTVVLKISNAIEVEGIVDFQVKALQHIAERDPSVPVPHMIATKSGKLFDWITADDGTAHMIRILSFLEGDVVYDTPAAHNATTRYNAGALVGKLAKALGNFFHPHARSNIHLWDISRALDLRPHIDDIEDLDLRTLCHDILERAESFTLPKLKSTRWQVVHQDAHSGNMLVDPNNAFLPTGIIDFGDMGYNSIVAEVVEAADSFSLEDDDLLANLCEVTAGFDSSYPLEENEIDLIYDALLLQYAVGSIVVGSRLIHDQEDNVHVEDADKYGIILKRLYQHGREQGIRRLREACRFPVYSPREADDEIFDEHYDEIFAKRENKLGPIWHFYNKAMRFTRAKGGWMYAADGTAYLDSYNNVPQIGHSHPHVVKAIARQAAVLNTNTRYVCDIAADYAERLTAELPDHLDTCIFVNSGSEANDLAMQIAKAMSGNQGGLVLDMAYHGCTELSAKMSHDSWAHLPPEQWPQDIEPLMVPDTYRGPYAGDLEAGEKYAADMDRAITALAQRGHKPAAFMVDTAMCAHGLTEVPDNYFNLTAEKTRAAGGYMIADEVQAGCGRMGTFWGYRAAGLKHENVDFITMGKPVGNAHPLGVIILSSKMMLQFLNGSSPMLFSTFGGNSVACAAGMAVLDVIEREGLIEKSNRVGDYLRAELSKLAEKHSIIGDIRGRGILTGVEFVSCRKAKTPASAETDVLIEAMLARRVMVGKGADNVLKLRPSMAWDETEVDFFIAALSDSLEAIAYGR
ncbi:MAG: aminotransferase class III-fold pyridoxal phosphate-dependent enzyme [Pseudomonadales bacterium]